MSAEEAHGKDTLTVLQAGRALAALSVVYGHAIADLSFFGQATQFVLPIRGGLGVEFFFVLSGFIIMFVHGRDQRNLASASSYLWKRAVRIYVPYLPVGIGLAALYLTFPDVSQGAREWGWFATLTLLPAELPPALSVAWTLVHEVVFYLVFLAAFYLTRHFWPIVIFWAVAIIGIQAAYGFAPGFRTDWFSALFAPINLDFIAGLAAARAYRTLARRNWPVWLAASIAVLGVAAVSEFLATYLIGPGLALLMLSLVQLEALGKLRAPRWLTFLGAASYAIYLVHNPIMSGIKRATAPLGSWEFGGTACLVGAVVAGSAYHLLYEGPAMRFLRGRFPRRPLPTG